MVDWYFAATGEVRSAVTHLDDRSFAVTSPDTDGQRILSAMRVLNPDKRSAAFDH
jgi:hypothetical protein